MDVTKPAVVMAIVQAPCVRCKAEKPNFEPTCDHVLLINGQAIPLCKQCLTHIVMPRPGDIVVPAQN